MLTATGPAYAHEAAPATHRTADPQQPPAISCDAEPAPGAVSCEHIYVTGSRIRRPNLNSAQPIITVTGAELLETGKVAVGDELNDLPQFRSTFSQSNSTRLLTTAGLNLLDLRGLGAERTLVLVNGRRYVGGDIGNTGVAADVGTIPPDLIERVDVVTGGNSAVYGSDAIAGVVNFVLKTKFDGVRIRAQSGISNYGDAGTYVLSGLAGQTFADGRGSLIFNAGYRRQDDFYGSRRPWLAQATGFVAIDSDPPFDPSDGTPDRRLFPDLRNAGFSSGGTLRFNTGECGADQFGTDYLCPFQFRPDGTLIPFTGERVGLGPTGVFSGGNGENFREGRELQLTPRVETLNLALLGHFEVSAAFVPFVEATLTRKATSGTAGGAGHFAITGTQTGDPRERPRLDNPYLSDQARDLITEQLTLQNGVVPAANTRLTLREIFSGLPFLTEDARRQTFRLVGGVKGSFGDDWNYEVSANYGRVRERTKIRGNPNIQRFLLAADAAIDPATNQIVCRSEFDPAARIGFVDEGETLANDIAECTPINMFGGQFTREQMDYLLLDTIARSGSSQFDLTGFVVGKIPGVTLQGGPISFVGGAEYRSDKIFYRQDPRVSQGYTFYNSIPPVEVPKSTVKEVFGELRFPIAMERPFLHLLEFNAAARASNYSLGKTGTVLAYNAALQWAPFGGLRLRGAFARAVRAPNESELFSPAFQNFAPSFADPCSARNLGAGSSNRPANCAEAGRPTFTYGTEPYGPNGYDLSSSDALEIVSSGNPDLREETSDSFTVGTVLTPPDLPGFSVSVDYYSISVKNVISYPGAQAIVNACYDAADLDNPFCALFQRNAATDTIIPNPANPNNPQIIGNGPNGEFQFQIIQGSLLERPLNFAKLTARGIDVEVAFRGKIGKLGRLDSHFVYTHLLERSQNLDPTDPARKDVLLLEVGDPRDAFNWNSSLNRGKLTLGYQLRYIGKMVINQYEDLFSVQGRPPQNDDFSDPRFLPARMYHDVRVGFEAHPQLNFYAGVENLTNTHSRFGAGVTSDGGAIYDARGRFFYFGAVTDF